MQVQRGLRGLTADRLLLGREPVDGSRWLADEARTARWPVVAERGGQVGRLPQGRLDLGQMLTGLKAGRPVAPHDVHPRVAMAILRNSKIALTMEIYTQVPDKVTRDALRQLSDQLDHGAGRMPDEAAG